MDKSEDMDLDLDLEDIITKSINDLKKKDDQAEARQGQDHDYAETDESALLSKVIKDHLPDSTYQVCLDIVRFN